MGKQINWIIHALMWGLPFGLWGQNPSWQDSTTAHKWVDSLIDQMDVEPDQQHLLAFYQAWDEVQATTVPASVRFWVSFGIGECYQILAQPDSGLHWYEIAKGIGEGLWGQESQDLSQALNGIAICYMQERETDLALHYAYEVLHIRQGVLDSLHPDLAQAYNNLGIISHQAGRYDSCRNHLAAAAHIWSRQDSVPMTDLLTVYNNLGIISSSFGDDPAAVSWYKKILAEADHLPPNRPAHQTSRGGVYNNISQAYRRQGDLAQAILYLRQSLDLARQYPSQDPRALGIKYTNLGSLFLGMGEIDSSLQYIQAGLEHQLTHLPPSHGLIFDSHQSLGRAWLAASAYDKALASFQLPLRYYQQKFPDGHPYLASLYILLGQAHWGLGDSAIALRELEEGMRMREEFLGMAHPYTRDAQLLMVQWLKGRNPDGAWQMLQQAQPEPGEASPIAIQGLTALGDWHQDAKEWGAAWEAYQQALTLTDSLWRRYRLSGSQTRLMNEARPAQIGALTAAQALFQETADLQYLREAWQLSEKSRALGLREALQGLYAKSFGTVSDSLAQAEERLRQNLMRVERSLARAQRRERHDQVSRFRQEQLDLQTQQDVLMDALAAQAPRYYAARFARQYPSLSALQAWLGAQDQDLIEYFIHEQTGFVLLVRPDTLHLVSICLSGPIEDKVLTLRESLFQEGQPVVEADSFIAISRELFQALVEPIQAVAPDLRERLLIVPDGPLGYIPFGLLLDREAYPSTSWSTLPYWIHRHEISYAYAADWLLEVGSQSSGADAYLLALAPDTDQKPEGIGTLELRSGWAPLRHHWQEATQVAKQTGGDVWLHDQANETALKTVADRYQVLHFSTHAAVDDQFPRYSFLQLAAAEEDDGLLEVAELYGLKLDADLVVLSACETGLGRYRQGDGIVSLGQGFSYAGARSVLMTLWRVNDAASAQFMTTFYQQLELGLGRAAALRHGQLEALTSHDPLAAHPFFWAAYQLSGQPGPLVKSTMGLKIGQIWLIGGIMLILGLGGLGWRWWRKRGQTTEG